MTKVYISPTDEQVKADNGVGQVVIAQHRYLPQLGIELVSHPDQADVIAAHIQQGDLPRVDVLHAHGLYWSDVPHEKYNRWHHEANRRIVDAARKAIAITVPSEWVAACFRRDMRITPHVIPHGVDLEAWEPAESQGYVLFNKNRASDVCDPWPAYRLAEAGISVVATFAPHGVPLPETMRVIGTQPHDVMRELVRHADVYLATTLETFGIGTLEALAAGVPVLGYAWGGTADIVNNISGWLSKPGDFEGPDGLIEGYRLTMLNRKAASKMARLTVQERYSWPTIMQRYADLYHEVAEQRRRETRVSVVITNYNYGTYLEQAIDSSLPADEVIVVDDGSTDSSLETVELYGPHKHVSLIQQPNQGVAAARNNGIAAATGDYIICLDADDALDPRYIAACKAALDADRGLGVAYTGLALWDGETARPNAWPPPFDWSIQTTPAIPPSNTIPCAAMFRRALWERAGGYRQVYAPAEDTEFFTRGLSVGFTARKITDEALFLYRPHDDSASRTKEYKRIDAWHPWMRDHDYPMAAPSETPPVVRSYALPTVSVIIPVGPGHARYLPAALDSLLGQTCRSWEVIVIDDDPATGFDAILAAYPFARYRFMPDARQSWGAGAARNIGLKMARAPLVLFLDADDYLLPDALTKLLAAYVASEGKYVYSDWIALEADGTMRPQVTADYDQRAHFATGQHAVTALIPTDKAREVGGFNEELPAWEDWDFAIKLAVAGVCGVRVPEPLLVYRVTTGQRRAHALKNNDELRAAILDRYAAYIQGDREMGNCCGGNAAAILAAINSQRIPDMPNAQTEALEGAQHFAPATVRMSFTGANTGAVPFQGPSGRIYRGGNNPLDRYHNVDPRDVEHLAQFPGWQVEQQAPAPIAAAPILDVPNLIAEETQQVARPARGRRAS